MRGVLIVALLLAELWLSVWGGMWVERQSQQVREQQK